MTNISFLFRILPFHKKEKHKMAELICAHCLYARELEWHHPTSYVPSENQNDIIRGVLTCRMCGEKSVFEMTKNAISFYPGKDLFGETNRDAPNEVKDYYSEAILSFYGAAYRSAVSMARATVEQALVKKGVKEDKLEKMIDDAFSRGIITQQQQMLAHGSRLVGNDALHQAKVIKPVEAQSALSACVQISNHLFP